MKSKWIIGLAIMCVLAVSAGAQQQDSAQPSDGAIVSVPHQQSSDTPSPLAQLQPGAAPDAQGYPQQLESVLAAMSAELAEIAQAVREGKITREQGEYLSMERYYVAMTRFQLLRTMYQEPSKTTQVQSNDQPNIATQVNNPALPALTCSPDLPEQLIGYLQLTPVQVRAIETQVNEQCKQVKPLLEKLENSRRKEIEIKVSGKFDAQKAQALAAEQSGIIKQLLVANSQLETQLYNMLTSEQKQKVDGLLRQNLGTGTNLDLRVQ